MASANEETKYKNPEESTDLMMEDETGAGKSTTNVESDKINVITYMRNEDNEDTCFGVPEEKKSQKRILERSFSVNTLKRTFENKEQTNSIQKQDKFCKMGETEKKKEQTTQIVSTKHRSELNEDRCAKAQQGNQKMEERTDLRIVMVGKTGAGKSSTGNTILRQKVFKEYLSTESLTEECQKHERMVEVRNISVIDTPGLFETQITGDKLKKEIEKGINMSAPGPHAFLLVIRLDVKHTDEEKNSVIWIEKNFGEEALRYAIILFTRGDQLDTTIEEFLKVNNKLRKLVVQCKGGYHVFNNKDEENQLQVTELLEKIDRMLKSNGGDYYNYEIYEEAQRKNEDAENMMRKEDERRKLEEEEKIRKDEKMKILNAVKNVVLLGVGLAGAAFGGFTVGDAGGGARAVLITGAVAVGAGVLAGFIPSGVMIAGAVVMGGAALISTEWAAPILTPLVEKGAEAVISKMQSKRRRKSTS